MKVLVACEESQRVTIEFRKLGHEAYSCDLLDCSGNHPEWHIKKDVTLLLNGNCIFYTVDGAEHEISGKWDMIVAFPPCTYLTVTGNRWFNYEKYGDKAMATQWGCKTVKDQYFDTDSVQPNKTIIENINHCPNQNTCCIVSPFVHCDYNYKSEACIKAHKNFNHYCEQVHKQLKAKHKPEWHHVRLATLANIDFDRLDEKRKLVCNINQILKDGIRNLYKCENHISFEVLERYVVRKCDELIRHNHLKAFWFSYIARQLDEVRRNTIYLYTPYITTHRNRW